MSGIYIPGMEMPTNCFDCPCVEAEFMECAAKEHLSLPKDEYGAALGEVPNWCPLIPVPEHGRLIDADEFIRQLSDGSVSGAIQIGISYRMSKMPTIIPADKEGEG